LEPTKQALRIEKNERTLRQIDYFAGLPDDSRRRLATLAQTRLYADQEVILRQGEESSELFIIEAGEVAVTLSRPDEAATDLARLGPGTYVGEMSLLTGEPCTATVRASGECEMLVVGKAAFAEMLTASPALAENIANTVTSRRAGLKSKLAEQSAAEQQPAERGRRLLAKIKSFFSL
jgi:CRP-like cAMP-binding protein